MADVVEVTATVKREAPAAPASVEVSVDADADPDAKDVRIAALEAEVAKLKQEKLAGKASALSKIVSAKKLSGLIASRARGTSIPLELLDPDVDGDGKLSKEEAWLHEQFKRADKDGSGFLSTKEMFSVFDSVLKTRRQRSVFRCGEQLRHQGSPPLLRCGGTPLTSVPRCTPCSCTLQCVPRLKRR